MTDKDRKILVVNREKLFRDFSFSGWVSASSFDFASHITQNQEWMPRAEVEQNPTYKQPIPYSIIISPEPGAIFAYQRAKEDQHYGEKRLQGKWSWGVGGHVELTDQHRGDPLAIGRLRELREEIKEFNESSQNMKRISTLGYIYLEDTDVDKVHFGIVSLVETNLRKLTARDKEITNEKFMEIRELEAMCENPTIKVENWSRIVLPYLKQALASLF